MYRLLLIIITYSQTYQAIPEAPGILRPDLVAKSDTTITIVDETVPYESGPDAFNSARAEKTQKYSELTCQQLYTWKLLNLHMHYHRPQAPLLKMLSLQAVKGKETYKR